jgi:hypothetical protein
MALTVALALILGLGLVPGLTPGLAPPAQAQLLLPPDRDPHLDATLGQFMDGDEEVPDPPAFKPGEAVPDLELAPGLGFAGWMAPRLSAIPARVVVLNLGSDLCPPCHREADTLNAMAALIRERGLESRVALVTLAVGDGAKATARFMKRHNATWTFFPDPKLAAHAALGENPIPAFLVLRQGTPPVVLEAFTGELTASPAAFLKRVLDLDAGQARPGRKKK